MSSMSFSRDFSLGPAGCCDNDQPRGLATVEQHVMRLLTNLVINFYTDGASTLVMYLDSTLCAGYSKQNSSVACLGTS